MVLVLVVVLGVVVVAVANHATTTLRFGQVVEASADRLATANGAMDNALEDIERNESPCVLLGQSYTLAVPINGIYADITCAFDGADPNRIDLFAVMLTGAGAGRTGPLLTVTNGGNSPQAQKVFEGPVYMASAPNATSLSMAATLTIKEGSLWYSDGSCPGAVNIPNQLTIASGYTTKCVSSAWTTFVLPKKPPEPAVTNAVAFPLRSSNPPAQDPNGCFIWPAGRYDSPPNLAHQSYNYFQSGDYWFNFGGSGNWSVDQAFVLFGWPGTNGPGIDGPKPQDTFANNPCRAAWTETNHNGAAIYLGGKSNITVQQNTTFEVSGKEHSGFNVGIQALEGAGVASTVQGNSTIVRTATGGNKELSIQGLVWAPYAAFEFDLISNDAVAALTGGIVIGELSAGASANANNFLIAVDTQPRSYGLNMTATATNQGTTAVKSNLTLQPSGATTNFAMNSRRVIGLTPE